MINKTYLLALLLLTQITISAQSPYSDPLASTYSIVARDSITGEMQYNHTPFQSAQLSDGAKLELA